MATKEKPSNDKTPSKVGEKEKTVTETPFDDGNNQRGSSDKKAKEIGNASNSSSAESMVFTLNGIALQDILTGRNPEISLLMEDIANYEKLKKSIKEHIAMKKALLKPVPRNELKLLGKRINKPSKEERKALKVEIHNHETQLIQVEEHLELDYERLTIMSKNESGKLMLQKLKDKANSGAYTKRNKYFISKGMLDTLNAILTGSDLLKKDEFNKVRRAAFEKGEGGMEKFNEQFASLLRSADEKIYILCSGKLKKALYESARLTLERYNPKDPVIKELAFPEEKSNSQPIEIDPLQRNLALISSLILNFLNKALQTEDTKNQLKSLSELSKDDNTEQFLMKLDHIMLDMDAELYILCSGELKPLLFNVIRLTLQKWDHDSSFSELILN